MQEPHRANPNDIDPALLGPRLLHDEAEMAAYMKAWPSEQYEVFTVDGVGQFYLDDLPEDGIKRWLRDGVVWEEHLVRILERYARPGTTVIDAGAHVGTHTLTLARLVGPEGRVYAFEPQKKLYRELLRNLELNGATQVTAARFALGDVPAIVEMNSTHPHSEGSISIGQGGDRVELRTIDSFHFSNVSLIKIDVEGFEDRVLDGARATIERWRPVLLLEIQGGYDYDDAPAHVRAAIDATKQKVVDLGYGIERVHVHDYLALPEP